MLYFITFWISLEFLYINMHVCLCIYFYMCVRVSVCMHLYFVWAWEKTNSTLLLPDFLLQISDLVSDVDKVAMLECLLKFFIGKMPFKSEGQSLRKLLFLGRNVLERSRDFKARKLEIPVSSSQNSQSLGRRGEDWLSLSQWVLLISENPWDNSSGWQSPTWSFCQSTHSMWSFPSVTRESRSTEQEVSL